MPPGAGMPLGQAFSFFLIGCAIAASRQRLSLRVSKCAPTLELPSMFGHWSACDRLASHRRRARSPRVADGVPAGVASRGRTRLLPGNLPEGRPVRRNAHGFELARIAESDGNRPGARL